MRRRLFGSVQSRMALGATAVVAVAMVAAGIAVLLSLRANLTEQAQSQANDTARRVALTIATRKVTGVQRYAALPLPDDLPVQVTTEGGRLLAVGKGLEKITGTGVTAVGAVAPAGPVAPPAGATPRPSPSVSAPASGSASASASPSVSSTGEDDHGGGRGRGRGGDGSTSTGDDESGSRTADDRGGSNAAATADPVVGEIGDTVEEGAGRATLNGTSGEYRFASVKATDLDGQTVVVHAGASLAARQSAVGTAGAVMLAGLPLLLAVVGAVTWLVTRRALAPVEGIRREMAAITASQDLTRRVPEPSAHDEVARLARTTNQTLTALEASVERQRRFVADASHELRSPIASLRTQLEVGSAHPLLLDVPGAVKDTVRLQQLAADLLLLARLDAGESPGLRKIDLGELAAREVLQRAAGPAPVTLRAEPGREVAGSANQLARVIGNLIDNAQRHASTHAAVSVRRHDHQIVLTVTDDGPGVPPAERERIFERFVRLDDARSRDDGGAGLGLAIARDITRRHGGTLTVGTGPAGGARFELRLPVAVHPAGAARS